MQSISRLLWTCGQDDELVIDNQGFWFGRSCEELPEYRAIECLTDERLGPRAKGGCATRQTEMPHCGNSAARPLAPAPADLNMQGQ
jgi:hypothetical protein